MQYGKHICLQTYASNVKYIYIYIPVHVVTLLIFVSITFSHRPEEALLRVDITKACLDICIIFYFAFWISCVNHICNAEVLFVQLHVKCV